MLNLPKNPVFNKIQANNARISPNANSNNSVTEHNNFSMLHPQRASESSLMDVLNQLDLENPTQQTNGVIKGHNKDCSGNYMITPGVIKYKPGHANTNPPSTPDTNYNPPTAEDTPVEAPADAPVDAPAGQAVYNDPPVPSLDLSA